LPANRHVFRMLLTSIKSFIEIPWVRLDFT